jgi:DNA-binding NtrC family response regulator
MKVLLVGGSGGTKSVFRAFAGTRGWELEEAATLSQGLEAIARSKPELTVLSTELPGFGTELLSRLIGEEAGAIVLVSDQPTPELALRAMRVGARELLSDPVAEEDVARVADGLMIVGERVPISGDGGGEWGSVVGRSSELMGAFRLAGKVAESSATVLIAGESGTGKELMARAIHEASPRATQPFVAVNCAAIPEDLLESELFGHERGAFTGAVARKTGRFERANGGSLFLDEIGDMSLVLQAKILRAIQEGEIERLGSEERLRVDVRILAATHRNLAERIAVGEFREDLYYRLAVVTVKLPPLRERPGDVIELALHFFARFAREYGRDIRFVTKTALTKLEAHPWYGNVRELSNTIQRAVLIAQGDTIDVGHLLLEPPRGEGPSGEYLPGYRPSLTLAEVEALHIARVLEEVDGQVGRAAEILGVHRNTVSRKLSDYGIPTR